MTLQALALALIEMTGAPRGTVTFKRIIEHAPVVLAEATRAMVNPIIVGAIIVKESMFDPDAIGAKGEVGLMQVKPDATALMVCQDLLDVLAEPWANIRCGIRILKSFQRRCQGLVEHGLSAYSGRKCGPSRYASEIIAMCEPHANASPASL